MSSDSEFVVDSRSDIGRSYCMESTVLDLGAGWIISFAWIHVCNKICDNVCKMHNEYEVHRKACYHMRGRSLLTICLRFR